MTEFLLGMTVLIGLAWVLKYSVEHGHSSPGMAVLGIVCALWLSYLHPEFLERGADFIDRATMSSVDYAIKACAGDRIASPACTAALKTASPG